MSMSQAIIKNPEELADKLTTYPQYCIDNKKKMTYAGFCLYCGYSNKQSLWDLKHRDNPEYARLMGILSLMLEEQSASNLLKPGQPVAGCIFNLKNNCGDTNRWIDKQDIESGGLVIRVVSSIDREEERS